MDPFRAHVVLKVYVDLLTTLAVGPLAANASRANLNLTPYTLNPTP